MITHCKKYLYQNFLKILNIKNKKIKSEYARRIVT